MRSMPELINTLGNEEYPRDKSGGDRDQNADTDGHTQEGRFEVGRLHVEPPGVPSIHLVTDGEGVVV